jgi:uncharacterized protein with NAD-binding domain and iron-sulfur cluster
LEATAPVFGESPQLPSPLGQAFATINNFKRLPLTDRLSIAGLLVAMLDLNRNDAVYEQYDGIDALTLFKQLRISDRMINEFLRPILLVGLFKPPEELSAAVTMELLYYYALAHQDSFDVRWIKSKSIAEQLLAPLSQRLRNQHHLDVLGGTLASRLNVSPDGTSVTSVETHSLATGRSAVIHDVDAVVLAVGAKGMEALMANSPECAALSPELVRAGTLGAIDVVSVRLWLDRTVPVADPANVLSRFQALQGSGATFFMLDQLQPDTQQELWGADPVQGSVVASDFYNSTAIAELSDQGIVDCLMQELLPMVQPDFRTAQVVDQDVRRYPRSVSLFSPGSFKQRPPLETSMSSIVCAGDWVRMEDREFGAKGLCQERAYVCGLEAGNSLLKRKIVSGTMQSQPLQHPVIPIRADEPQVVFGRTINKLVMDQLDLFGLKHPWLRS